jgi:serine/threonine-protein kinase ATR
LWTSPGTWPLQISERRKELCADEVESFTDSQLLKDAASVLKSFRVLNLGDEDDRPAKRRKTRLDSTDDVNETTYENLKIILTGGDHEAPVANLSNLHNIVQ